MDASQQTAERIDHAPRERNRQIRLTDTIAEQLAAIARRESNSISAVGRRLLVAALAQELGRVA